VRKRLGTRGDALARQLEELDALRYGRHAAARPSPAWWRAFDRSAQALVTAASQAPR
jgi:hypothetical protein